MTRNIVVRKRPAGPGIPRLCGQLIKNLLGIACGQCPFFKKLERVAHVHPLIAGGVFSHNLKPTLRVADLTQTGTALVFIRQGAQAFQKRDVFRLAFGIQMVLVIIGVYGWRDRGIALLDRKGWVVPQLFVVKVKVDRIQTEAINPQFQPEPCHIQQGILHLTAMEIQIGL